VFDVLKAEEAHVVKLAETAHQCQALVGVLRVLINRAHNPTDDLGIALAHQCDGANKGLDVLDRNNATDEGDHARNRLGSLVTKAFESADIDAVGDNTASLLRCAGGKLPGPVAGVQGRDSMIAFSASSGAYMARICQKMSMKDRLSV